MQSATSRKFPSDLPESLIRGEVVLADVFGLDRSALYEIASIGFAFLNAGKLTEAKQIYEGLVAADPYDSVFHCHLGATHHRFGELDEAFRQYELAIQLNHANGDALVGRGEIYLLRGQLVEGVTDLKEAVIIDREGKRVSTARAHKLLLALKSGQ